MQDATRRGPNTHHTGTHDPHRRERGTKTTTKGGRGGGNDKKKKGNKTSAALVKTETTFPLLLQGHPTPTALTAHPKSTPLNIPTNSTTTPAV